MYFLSWDSKWPPPIFRQSSALGLTSLTACSPHLLLVQGVTEVSHHRLELLKSAGLDSSDLCLAIAPEVVVTWSLVGAARRPRDLRVTGDHASPELLPDPLE